MRRRGVRCLALLPAVLVALGCVRRPLRDAAPPHGNFTAVVAHGLARTPEPTGSPVAVLFGEAEVVGLRLDSGETAWRRPMRIFGAPATAGRLVAVPLRGHRLALLDADTGATIWERALPGEAFTGVALTERRVVVTVVDPDPDTRSIVAALSTADGRLRWRRRSPELLGVPAALGHRVLLPAEDEAIALSLRTGREIARMRPPSSVGRLGRIELDGKTALAAGANAFVDLYGGGRTVYAMQPLRSRAKRGDRWTTTPAFRVVDGLDPGLGHADGIAWRLRPRSTAGAPRHAVLMARRVAFGVRLDAQGRPVEAQWIHRQSDALELVALHVERDVVSLVREDGSILQVHADHGTVLREIEGDRATLGAVVIGRSPTPPASERSAVLDPLDELIVLLDDLDPRLLPAQRVAVDLLWRHEDPRVRAVLYDLVQGGIRPELDEASEALRRHADHRMSGGWGPADDAARAELLAQLEAAHRGRLPTKKIEAMAAHAVHSGDPVVIQRLVELLERPGLNADALVAVTRALRDLDDARAVPGVGEFVLRYHADPEVVHESQALYYALDLLVTQSRADAYDLEARSHARQILTTIRDDRFTVPEIRAFLRDRWHGDAS